MAITQSEDDRKLGVVWHDPAVVQKPATHVMIVGVGQFDAPGLQPLKSTPASAKALADWFLEGARNQAANGFASFARPLGSLALLLSDNDDGAPSIFEGAAVPRATFKSVKDALRAWVARAEANDGSVAILVFFSHGQAERRRTAVLFEDYGGDPRDPYAGMTEAEQLVDALATLAPRDKLVVFDCCRTEVDLQLLHQGNFGTSLIGGHAGAIPVRPQVMMSTQYDGIGFGGKNGRPTLFATALLHGLRGCAADSDDLTINTRRLGEITEKILRLWRKDEEPIQVPDTQESRSFVITKIPNVEFTTVFVSLEELHDINTSKITVFEGDNIILEAVGPNGPDPFLRIDLPSDRTYRLVARDKVGVLIGEETRRSRPPVGFRKLPPDPPENYHRTERMMHAGDAAEPRVEINAVGPSAGAAIVTFNRVQTHGIVADSERNEFDLVASELGMTEATLPSGTWVMNLRRPGIPPVARRFEVSRGDTVKVDIPQAKSPHEWLAGAMAAGVLPSNARRLEGGAQRFLPPKVLDGNIGVELIPRGEDPRFTLFAVNDSIPQRFELNRAKQQYHPVWIEAEGLSGEKRWRERAFVPVLGSIARYFDGGSWGVEVLIDSLPLPRSSHLSSYAVSQEWGPLLAFLGRRDFPEAGAALRALDLTLKSAIIGKDNNPIAAICGALVAVATHQIEVVNIPEQWLENLCNWFPTLPDGAVILARHRLHQGRSADGLLEEAVRRGIPVTSLAVDWLAEALAMAGHPSAAEARDTAMSCDPTKAFTVLQLPPEV